MPSACCSSNFVTEHEDAVDDIQYIVKDEDTDSSTLNTDVSTVEMMCAVVKMKLNSFCTSPQLNHKINSVVLDANVLLGEAYAFSNFHIRRLLEERSNGRISVSLDVKTDRVVVNIQPRAVPEVDRKFFYRCLLAVATSNCRPSTLGADFQESILLFDALRPPGQVKVNIAELNQVVADLSITMATMASNHLWTNLERRLHTYVKSMYPMLKSKWKDIVRGVVKEQKAHVDSLFPLTAAATGNSRRSEALAGKVAVARRVVSDLRTLLPLKTSKRHASHAHLTLPLYFQMLQHEETRQESRQDAPRQEGAEKSRRVFSLLPVKGGYTISNIPISSMFMLKLLKTLQIEKNIPGDGRTVDAMVYWRKHFNINAVETQTRRFDGRIVTDGRSVSVLLAKPSSIVTSNSLSPSQSLLYGTLIKETNVRMVAVDPGYKDVVTMCTYANCEESKEYVSYSSARYYETAKFNVSRRRTTRWNNETKELTSSVPSPKTASAKSMDAYLTKYLTTLTPLTQHRHAKGYRNMRFMRYVHKRKAINEICDIIAPPSNFVILGFGDWKSGPTPISRRTSGPIEEIKLELANRDNVLMTMLDEYKTSATCSCCGGRLVNMEAKVTDRKTKTPRLHASKIHRTLHCKSRTCSLESDYRGTTWNRDVNASRNLMNVLLAKIYGQPRPIELQRPFSRR